MNISRYIGQFVVINGLGLLGSCPYVLADSLVTTRFITEAPIAWRAMEEFQDGLEGRYHKEMAFAPGSENANWGVEGEFKQINGNKYLHYELTDATGKSYQTTFCLNTEYGFALDRVSSNDPWEVGFAEKHKGNIHDRLGRQGGVLHMGITIDGQSLLWTVEQPEFKLKNARAIIKGEEELIEISFETSSYLFDDYRILGGRVVLDPEKFWVVREYTIIIACGDEKGTSDGKVEYSGQLDGFPLPKQSVTHTKSAGEGEGGAPPQLTITLGDLRQCTATDSEFMLTAFGLPEIGEPGSRGGQRWIWLNIFAIIFIAVAIFLRVRMKTRRRSKET